LDYNTLAGGIVMFGLILWLLITVGSLAVIGYWSLVIVTAIGGHWPHWHITLRSLRKAAIGY